MKVRFEAHPYRSDDLHKWTNNGITEGRPLNYAETRQCSFSSMGVLFNDLLRCETTLLNNAEELMGNAWDVLKIMC